jgi:hypothetical protein
MKPPRSATTHARSPQRQAFVPRTSLGKELSAIRTAALTAGMETVSWAEIDHELAEFRGGHERRRDELSWIEADDHPRLAAVWDNDDDAIFDVT